jgi:hypothetical protein
MSARTVIALLAFAAVMFTASAAAAAAGSSVYRSPVYGWSIDVPADWATDDSDAAGVVFADPASNAAVSVNVGDVHAESVDALAEDFVGLLKAMADDRDIAYEVLVWRPGKLADGTAYVEIQDRVGEGDGGRTVMRLFLHDRTATVVIGENTEAEWSETQAVLTAAVRSLHPGDTTVLTAVSQNLDALLKRRAAGWIGRAEAMLKH